MVVGAQTTWTVAKSLNVTCFAMETDEPLVLITGFNGILILAFALDSDVGGNGDDDPDDESDKRPADEANSLSFCERPLGGFIAIEWWAITVCDSFDSDDDGDDNNLQTRKEKHKLIFNHWCYEISDKTSKLL